MKSSDALLAAWQRILGRAKDSPAILNTHGEVVRKFSEIDARAHDFESKIETFKAGSVIAIQIGNHEDWASILIACLRRRLVVLPLEQSISDQQRDAALEICAAKVLVSAVPSGNSPTVFRLKTADATANWGEHSPSLLKLTSGTTAAPRAIRFRSEQLLADCNQICDTMGISDVDLNFGVIPISHSYGFSNLLTPLIARGVPIVLSRDRLPRAVLADLTRTNATVFSGMPVFYQAFCEMENIPDPTEVAALRFRRGAAGDSRGAAISAKIWTADTFVLRRVGMWRNLLRPRCTKYGRRFCRPTDERRCY